MTTRGEQLMLANLDGRAAQPGDRNPYAGDDYPLARTWRLGYKSMLEKAIGAPLSVFAASPGCHQGHRRNHHPARCRRRAD